MNEILNQLYGCARAPNERSTRKKGLLREWLGIRSLVLARNDALTVTTITESSNYRIIESNLLFLPRQKTTDKLTITTTDIPGLIVLEPKVFEDSRGYFFESYNANVLQQHGITNQFVQDNQSRSTLGVLRGLHYQREPYAQAKLVRVLSGAVLDVAVDLRKGSPTYKRWHSEVLSAENRRQMYIPRGFAHGFLVLTEWAEFFYKCDNFYSREHDGGVRYDDPELNIKWDFPVQTFVVSDKDRSLPTLAEAHFDFKF